MLQVHRTRFGELNCCVARLDTSANPPEILVVLCHGYGAPGTDLVALGSELVRQSRDLAQSTVFLFPEAPLSMEEFGLAGGRAWWPLDMLRLQLAIEQQEFRNMRNESPVLLPAARAKLKECLEAARREFDIPIGRMVLGGFSQGAMVAADLALRLPENPAALVIYSGTLLNEQEWAPLVANRAGLPVLQSHGEEDPILPFEAAEWLRDFLAAARLDTEFVRFRGGHTIPMEALHRTAELLQRISTRE